MQNSSYTITSGSSGTGNGEVNYTVSPNGSANQRVGTIMVAGQPVTITQQGNTTVAITVTTSPSGKQITVDGTTYTAPQIFNWNPGSTHTIDVLSPQSGGAGTQYVFSSWSDGGAQSHTITTPASSTTCTANFTTQYKLTTSVNPAGAGSTNPNCSAGCWYDSGESASLSATANSGYVFSSWSDGGAQNHSITMDSARNITANFASAAPAIALSPSNKDFGTINAGSTSSSQAFTISNTGTADLVVSSLSFIGGDSGMFSLKTGGANPCQNLTPTITAGGSCTVNVKFKPSSAGAKSATFRIISDASNSPSLDAALTGTGTIQSVFNDCPDGSFAENFINTLSYSGITGGCGGGNFCPNSPVTRAQMAVFMLAALGEQPASTCTGMFNDADASKVGDAFCRFIEKFATLGITAGCGGGNFCPNDPVTRAQMAVFLTTGFLQ